MMKCCGAAKQPRTTLLSTTWGHLLAVASGILISICTVIVKFVANIHPGQLAVYRFSAIASLALPKLVLSQKNIQGPPGSRASLIFFGISHATFILLTFIAFRYLPIGEAAVLSSCHPALVIVAGRVLLKEPLGLLHIISVGAIILGMIFISDFHNTIIAAHVGYTTERIYGLSAALGSLFFTAAMTIIARKMKGVDSVVLLFTSAVIGVTESMIVTLLIGDFSLNRRGLQQYLILLLGLFSYLGLACIIMALQRLEAGPVSTMRAASDIVFSFIWQIIIFGDNPSNLAILGAVLVCISLFIHGFMKPLSTVLPQKCSHLC